MAIEIRYCAVWTDEKLHPLGKEDFWERKKRFPDIHTGETIVIIDDIKDNVIKAQCYKERLK